MNEQRFIDRFKKTDKWQNKAKKYVDDKEKTDELIKEAMEKAAGKNGFEEIYDNVKLLFELAKDSVRGNYKELSKATMLTILGAIIYFVSPIDAILDTIPVLGFIDDAAILGFLIKQLDGDIKKYKVWKEFKDENKKHLV